MNNQTDAITEGIIAHMFDNTIPLPDIKKRKIKIVWSCSDYCHHEHKYKWTAYLCGRVQYLISRLRINLKTKRPKGGC